MVRTKGSESDCNGVKTLQQIYINLITCTARSSTKKFGIPIQLNPPVSVLGLTRLYVISVKVDDYVLRDLEF